MATVTEVFSAPCGHCHYADVSAPYGDCHSAPYRRTAVTMKVPNLRTASRQRNVPGSHSYHFDKFLYPRS